MRLALVPAEPLKHPLSVRDGAHLIPSAEHDIVETSAAAWQKRPT